jgi:hypothetical protein
MEFAQSLRAAKPLHHRIALQLGRNVGRDGLPRRPRPIPKIRDEAMLLWVEVNVENQVGEVGITVDVDAIKVLLKEFARSGICLVNRL